MLAARSVMGSWHARHGWIVPSLRCRQLCFVVLNSDWSDRSTQGQDAERPHPPLFLHRALRT
eukprot:7024656-Pyramimonas_sp.AAC.1